MAFACGKGATMNRRTILPPQTTPLERAVDQAFPFWDWMAVAVSPEFVRQDPEFTPWLALDWQVAQFAPYFDTAQDLLAAALPWLRLRGTAAAVRMALDWVGWPQVWIDQDEAWLHIDPGRIVSNDDLLPMAHVVRASLPAHVRFYRVYHGWDARPVRLDGHDWLDAGLLDDDSGVFVDVTPYGAPVKVSQGVTRVGTAAAPPLLALALAAHTRIFTSVATYTDRLILDTWVLDSELIMDSSGGNTLLHSALAPAHMRRLPFWLPPAKVLTRLCAWSAPAALQSNMLARLGMAERINDDTRTWTGGWDSAPWRPFFLSRKTELTTED